MWEIVQMGPLLATKTADNILLKECGKDLDEEIDEFVTLDR